MSTVHSNFIGGSNARARIACPGSWQMEQKLPPSAKKESSVFADEGSALHAAIAYLLDNDQPPHVILDWVFDPYTDYPITQELIDTAIVPCIEFFDSIVGEDSDFYVERRVEIAGLPGVFGTCDVLARTRDSTVVGDWKFGVGEKVDASYMVPQGSAGIDAIEVANAQLMFYALGAANTYPGMFNLDDPDWLIELFVAQPRYRDGPNFTSVVVKVRDLTAFEDRLKKTAVAMRKEDPFIHMGDHCRFMACKTICPLHTGPMLELPDFLMEVTTKQLEASVVNGSGGGSKIAAVDWGQTYRLMLDLADKVEPLIHAWRAQAQAYLEAGHVIPSWKLVDKRATRKWIREVATVDRRLAKAGLTKDERMPRALVSPAQAEKLLKARGHKLPDGYVDAISSGRTLAPDSDPRQAVQSVGDTASSLANLLADLTGSGTTTTN